ncbi:MAG TPA: HypC/HybG/HupF family hydrogenase formation chaperone [Thermoplasmata archaeon]
MCLTIPFRVRSVEGDRAIVESQGRVREVDVSRLSVKPGDYVLVQGGVAMMTVDVRDAEAMLEAWDEVGALDA